MPVIRFTRDKSPITVEKGSNLMEALLNAGVPVASSCGGEGVCSKCLLNIEEGSASLPAPNPTEKELKAKIKFPDHQRPSCQIFVHEDITVDAPYW